MWWLAVVAVLFFFRGKIAARVAPLLPAVTPQQVSYLGHSVTLYSGVVFVLPIEFVGLGGVKRVAYLICLWSTIGTAAMAMKANYGGPPMPESISIAAVKQMMSGGPLQEWLQKVMPSVDFSFLFFALIFATAYPSILVVGILGRRSLWSVCTHCSKGEDTGGRLFAMFKPRWEQLKLQEARVLLMSALAEVLMGLWLTVSLALPTRQILTCFLYWNYLRMRYQAPRSHTVHLQAWKQLEQAIAPVLKFAPFVNKPLQMAKDWFQPQYVQQTR